MWISVFRKVGHFPRIHNNLDLSSLSKFVSLSLFYMLSFNLCEEMEVWVCVLTFIFVGVRSDSVVVDGVIFPLHMRLDIELRADMRKLLTLPVLKRLRTLEEQRRAAAHRSSGCGAIVGSSGCGG